MKSDDATIEPLAFTKKQVADLLQVSLQSVDQMIKDGLPIFHVGTAVRVLKSDLNEWVKAKIQAEQAARAS